MQTWEQVLAHIESTLDSYATATVTGTEGDDFQLPANMPELPVQLQARVEAVQLRLAGLVDAHDHEMAGLRTTLAAASRITVGETGSLIDERA